MWIKVLGMILFGVIGIAFLMDLTIINYSYESAGRGIEHALDAGIIESGYVIDAQEGTVALDEEKLIQSTKQEFIRYMKFNNQMENQVMKDTSFQVQLSYDQEGIPWVQIQFHAKVSFSIPGVTYPVDVKRKIAYESTFI